MSILFYNNLRYSSGSLTLIFEDKTLAQQVAFCRIYLKFGEAYILGEMRSTCRSILKQIISFLLFVTITIIIIIITELRNCCFPARVGVQPSGNLHIADVRSSDEGVYQCVAVNAISSATTVSPQTTTLRVTGTTKSPTPVTIYPHVFYFF